MATSQGKGYGTQSIGPGGAGYRGGQGRGVPGWSYGRRSLVKGGGGGGGGGGQRYTSQAGSTILFLCVASCVIIPRLLMVILLLSQFVLKKRI